MANTIAKYALIVALLVPVGAHAQGVVDGARQGAEQGGDAAGPIGGVVGGAVGAVTGGVNGLLGLDFRPRFRQYVIAEHRPSFPYDREVVVGAVLPRQGVTYYEVPQEYGVTRYRYTVVNDQIVLVDPGSRRIVQVVD